MMSKKLVVLQHDTEIGEVKDASGNYVGNIQNVSSFEYKQISAEDLIKLKDAGYSINDIVQLRDAGLL